MEIAIVSDTHLPKGFRRLPDACLERLRAADVIVHAGDLSTLAVLEQLQSYGRVVAVHGNVDDAAVRAVLPPSATLDAGGFRLAVIHDAGPSRGRLERMRRQFPEADAVIFGHSHIPLHERAGRRLSDLQPGQPDGAPPRAPPHDGDLPGG